MAKQNFSKPLKSEIELTIELLEMAKKMSIKEKNEVLTKLKQLSK
ncbi:MAG: hypothetical protein ACOYM7_02715 [Paludibacter sp.]